MKNKLRYRILEKLSQTTPPGPLPTEEITETETVSGSPPSFVASDQYPGIMIGFTARNANIINKLSDDLNQALYITSNGKVHLPWMRSVNFNFGIDGTPSVDLKNLMGFAKQLYSQVYTNNGAADKRELNAEEIAKRIAPLKSSGFMSSLSTSNPIGQLTAKIGGNIKTLINNYLLQIK
jgi:hypothetical protein